MGMTDSARQGDDDYDPESYRPEVTSGDEDRNGESSDAAPEPATTGAPADDDDPPPTVFPDYAPTWHELRELARYWVRENLNFSVNYYLFGFTSASQSKRVAASGERLCRLEKSLGVDAVEKIVAQVEDKYRLSLGDRIWEIFTKGSRAELDAVREEISESMRYDLDIAPRAVPQGLLPADIGVKDCTPETWQDFGAYCNTSGLRDKLTEQVRAAVGGVHGQAGGGGRAVKSRVLRRCPANRSVRLHSTRMTTRTLRYPGEQDMKKQHCLLRDVARLLKVKLCQVAARE